MGPCFIIPYSQNTREKTGLMFNRLVVFECPERKIRWLLKNTFIFSICWLERVQSQITFQVNYQQKLMVQEKAMESLTKDLESKQTSVTLLLSEKENLQCGFADRISLLTAEKESLKSVFRFDLDQIEEKNARLRQVQRVLFVQKIVRRRFFKMISI